MRFKKTDYTFVITVNTVTYNTVNSDGNVAKVSQKTHQEEHTVTARTRNQAFKKVKRAMVNVLLHRKFVEIENVDGVIW